jgi:NDP-sugar pyrophosphorylase family protein
MTSGTAAVGIAAVVLAAGEGRRLRPLTEVRPKALCPVGNVTLLDRALARIAGLGLAGPAAVAVNACHLAEQVVTAVGTRARLSVEPGAPLGSSGGVSRLRPWIDGRAVLVANADAYLASSRPPGPDVSALLDGWDGDTVRLLGVPAGDRAGEFGRYRFAGLSLLPWAWVRDLSSEPSHLVHTVWRPAETADALTVVAFDGTYLDTGTPADYLSANLDAAGRAPTGAARGPTGAARGPTGAARGPTGGGSLVAAGATVTGSLSRAVIGAGARIEGRVTDAVVWPGGYVGPDEHLTEAIRVGRNLTVPAH